MEEIVTEFAKEVAKCLVDPILRHLRYLFCFNQFIKDVGDAKDELLPKLEEVEKRRDEATRKTQEIMPTVKKWLDDVKAILREVEKLQQEVEGGGKTCFNVSLGYSLAKQMENKANQMRDLKNISHSEPFCQLIELPGIIYFSSKGFVDFNSRKSIYNSLLEAIKDDRNKMVGLYGIGGSGKTTLAKEVGKKVDELKLFDKVIMDKKVDELKLFDKVIMVVVSKAPNVIKIQQEIAEQIGLKFEEEIPSNRAQRLSIALKNQKILIILDDVWHNINLEDIGIPLNQGCRIVITTRLQSVCNSMDCDSKIELPLLTKDEAWALFKICANLTNDSSNEFDGIGWKIIDECKGLPIAIAAVGSTLKGKSVEAWESALHRLQHCLPLDIDEGLRTPYACLKLSYDNLPNPVAKSLFLMCSMFPEDHEISKEDLIRFGKGTLELHHAIADTMKNSRAEILSTIDKLIDSCLLMPTDKQQCVKMHDVVRDVALLIVNERHQAILVDSHAVSNVLNSVNDTKVISLWNLEENFKLSIQLYCPTLEILLLHPPKFIEDLGGIEALKVLALITFRFESDAQWWTRSQWSMPQSIASLTKLHTLCLRGIELGDISFLDKLKGLEILDLRGSSFNELPVEIVDMKMLKLLDVFGCSIEKSPYEVIEKCEQLQELFLEVDGYSTPKNFFASELKKCIWDNEDINFKIKHLGVSRCSQLRTIFIIATIPKQNENVNIRMVNSELSYLKLDDLLELKYIWKGSTQVVYLHKFEEIRLSKCLKLKTLFSYVIIPSLPKLRELYIENCPELEGLVEGEADEEATQRRDQLLFSKLNSIELCRLPKLREIFPDFEHKHIQDCPEQNESDKGSSELSYLKLDDLPELEYIWKGPTQAVSLHKLEEVRLSKCSKLKTIFTNAIIPSLPELRELHIINCSKLEGLVEGEADEEATQRRDQLLFSKLNTIELCRLPKLREIFPGFEHNHIQDCPEKNENDRLREVNSELSYLKLVDLPELEDIWKGSTQVVSLHRLEKVRLSHCSKLRTIFTHAIIPRLPELRELYIENCSELGGLVEGEANEEATQRRDQLLFSTLNNLYLSYLPKMREIFPGLEYKHIQDFPQKCENDRISGMVNSELFYLNLVELPELEYIWKGSTPTVSLHRLEEVKLFKCSKLRTIFTNAIFPNLSKLRKLWVIECEELERIICEDSLKELCVNVSSPNINVCFPKLSVIGIYKCSKVKWVFSSYDVACHCPSLEFLKIEDCDEIEGVVNKGSLESEAHLTSSFPT